MNEFDQTAFRLTQSERIAARAVVVPEGEDPTPYLHEAGITEPIRLRYVDPAEGGNPASMSDGATPGVEATLVFNERTEESEQDNWADPEGNASAHRRDDGSKGEPDVRTVNLPEAFGMQPMAPAWRRR